MQCNETTLHYPHIRNAYANLNMKRITTVGIEEKFSKRIEYFNKIICCHNISWINIFENAQFLVCYQGFKALL